MKKLIPKCQTPAKPLVRVWGRENGGTENETYLGDIREVLVIGHPYSRQGDRDITHLPSWDVITPDGNGMSHLNVIGLAPRGKLYFDRVAKASGRVELVSPEFDVLMMGRLLVTDLGKSVASKALSQSGKSVTAKKASTSFDPRVNIGSDLTRNVGVGSAIGGVTGALGGEISALSDPDTSGKDFALKTIGGGMVGAILGGGLGYGRHSLFKLASQNRAVIPYSDFAYDPIAFIKARRAGLYPLTFSERRAYLEGEKKAVQNSKDFLTKLYQDRALSNPELFAGRNSEHALKDVFNKRWELEQADRTKVYGAEDAYEMSKFSNKDPQNTDLLYDIWQNLRNLIDVTDYTELAKRELDLTDTNMFAHDVKFKSKVSPGKYGFYSPYDNTVEVMRFRGNNSRLPNLSTMTGELGNAGTVTHELEHAILSRGMSTPITVYDESTGYYVTNPDSPLYNSLESIMQKLRDNWKWSGSLDEWDSELVNLMHTKGYPRFSQMTPEQKKYTIKAFNERFSTDNSEEILNKLSEFGF